MQCVRIFLKNKSCLNAFHLKLFYKYILKNPILKRYLLTLVTIFPFSQVSEA